MTSADDVEQHDGAPGSSTLSSSAPGAASSLGARSPPSPHHLRGCGPAGSRIKNATPTTTQQPRSSNPPAAGPRQQYGGLRGGGAGAGVGTPDSVPSPNNIRHNGDTGNEQFEHDTDDHDDDRVSSLASSADDEGYHNYNPNGLIGSSEPGDDGMLGLDGNAAAVAAAAAAGRSYNNHYSSTPQQGGDDFLGQDIRSVIDEANSTRGAAPNFNEQFRHEQSFFKSLVSAVKTWEMIVAIIILAAIPALAIVAVDQMRRARVSETKDRTQAAIEKTVSSIGNDFSRVSGITRSFATLFFGAVNETVLPNQTALPISDRQVTFIDDKFVQFCQEEMALSPSVVSFSTRPANILTQIYPAGTSPFGLNMNNFVPGEIKAANTISGGYVSGPRMLFQGYPGMVTYWPIWLRTTDPSSPLALDSEYWGTVGIVVNLTRFVQDLNIDQTVRNFTSFSGGIASAMHMSNEVTGNNTWFGQQSIVFDEDTQSGSTALYGVRSTVYVNPHTPFLSAPEVVVGLLILLLLLALFFVVVRLLTVSRLRNWRTKNCDNAPPSGKVCMMIASVADASHYWEQHDPQKMTMTLSVYAAIIRAVIADFQGYEVSTDGHSFLIACKDIAQAVKMSIAVHEAMAETTAWPLKLHNKTVGLMNRIAIVVARAHAITDSVTGFPLYQGYAVDQVRQIEKYCRSGCTIMRADQYARVPEHLQEWYSHVDDNVLVGGGGVGDPSSYSSKPTKGSCKLIGERAPVQLSLFVLTAHMNSVVPMYFFPESLGDSASNDHRRVSANGGEESPTAAAAAAVCYRSTASLHQSINDDPPVEFVPTDRDAAVGARSTNSLESAVSSIASDAEAFAFRQAQREELQRLEFEDEYLQQQQQRNRQVASSSTQNKRHSHHHDHGHDKQQQQQQRESAGDLYRDAPARRAGDAAVGHNSKNNNNNNNNNNKCAAAIAGAAAAQIVHRTNKMFADPKDSSWVMSLPSSSSSSSRGGGCEDDDDDDDRRKDERKGRDGREARKVDAVAELKKRRKDVGDDDDVVNVVGDRRVTSPTDTSRSLDSENQPRSPPAGAHASYSSSGENLRRKHQKRERTSASRIATTSDQKQQQQQQQQHKSQTTKITVPVQATQTSSDGVSPLPPVAKLRKSPTSVVTPAIRESSDESITTKLSSGGTNNETTNFVDTSSTERNNSSTILKSARRYVANEEGDEKDEEMT